MRLLAYNAFQALHQTTPPLHGGVQNGTMQVCGHTRMQVMPLLVSCRGCWRHTAQAFTGFGKARRRAGTFSCSSGRVERHICIYVVYTLCMQDPERPCYPCSRCIAGAHGGRGGA